MANSLQIDASAEALFLPETERRRSLDVSSLFSDGVLTRCDHRTSWRDSLTPQEKQQIGDVCGARYAEFAAGRSQARQLISALTGTAESVLSGSNSEPVWPEAIIGSISHCSEYCAVAVAIRSRIHGLGIDVERYEDLDEEVAEMVVTPQERAQIAKRDAHVEVSAQLGKKGHKLVFSIKEAIYKCCFPHVRSFIEFHQCQIEFDFENYAYSAVVKCNDGQQKARTFQIHGKWTVMAGHIFASAELEALKAK